MIRHRKSRKTSRKPRRKESRKPKKAKIMSKTPKVCLSRGMTECKQSKNCQWVLEKKYCKRKNYTKKFTKYEMKQYQDFIIKNSQWSVEEFEKTQKALEKAFVNEGGSMFGTSHVHSAIEGDSTHDYNNNLWAEKGKKILCELRGTSKVYKKVLKIALYPIMANNKPLDVRPFWTVLGGLFRFCRYWPDKAIQEMSEEQLEKYKTKKNTKSRNRLSYRLKIINIFNLLQKKKKNDSKRIELTLDELKRHIEKKYLGQPVNKRSLLRVLVDKPWQGKQGFHVNMDYDTGVTKYAYVGPVQRFFIEREYVEGGSGRYDD